MKKYIIVAMCDPYNAIKHYHGEKVLKRDGATPIHWVFKDEYFDTEDEAKEALLKAARYDYSYEDDESDAVVSEKKRRPNFLFSMVGISVGETLVFIPTGISVRVASDDQVEYQGRLYKLSPFVGTFLPEDKQTPSGAYQGAKFFSYKGKILSDLRDEIDMK